MLDLPENSPLKFATCGSDQVIARIPDHPLFLSIIKKVGLPIAAPSANTSGKVSPTSAGMVEEDLGSKIPGVVDGGSSLVGLESTILDARSPSTIRILRPGAIGEKEIRQVYAEGLIVIVDLMNEASIPGSKYRHYAPDVPVFLIEHPSDISDEKKCWLTADP
jgi:L-threonylcarbamoyladenylate synthase